MSIDWDKPSAMRRKQELDELSHRGKPKRERYEEASDMLQSLANRADDEEVRSKALADADYFLDKADREAEE